MTLVTGNYNIPFLPIQNTFGFGSLILPQTTPLLTFSNDSAGFFPFLSVPSVNPYAGLQSVSVQTSQKSFYDSVNELAHNLLSCINIPTFGEIKSNVTSFVSDKCNSIGTSITSTISGFGSKMVATARKYKGYNEADGSCKLFGGSRTVAWCAKFVSYVARECGVSNFKFSTVQDIWDWGVLNNKFSKNPKVGDAIILKGWDPKRKKYASHTGIVTRVENGRVYTIEGNTTDRVDERSYSLNDSKITGYVTIA